MPRGLSLSQPLLHAQLDVVTSVAAASAAGGILMYSLAGPTVATGPGRGKVDISAPLGLWLTPVVCPTCPILSCPYLGLGLERTHSLAQFVMRCGPGELGPR